MLLSLYSHFRFCFRHIQAYSSIIKRQTHIQNLLYPWHIYNPGIFISQGIFRLQNIFIIHNTILNVFTKAPSWTFDIVLNAPFSYRCILYGIFKVIFQTYSGMIIIYSVIFILVKAH